MKENKIPKIINYIWFGKGKKPETFIKCLKSWKKFCPDYEIIEWNETNFDVTKNKYCNRFYKKRKWAFASDYARIDVLYNFGGIYLDTDIEILKNFNNLLNNEAFIGFQDKLSIGGSIIGAKKGNLILKEILDYYNTKKIRIIIPNLLNRIFKKYGNIKYNSNINKIKNFKIYPKDYFYPYAYFEKPENINITKNTYTIHHYDATWLPKIIRIIFFPIIGYIVKKLK